MKQVSQPVILGELEEPQNLATWAARPAMQSIKQWQRTQLSRQCFSGAQKKAEGPEPLTSVLWLASQPISNWWWRHHRLLLAVLPIGGWREVVQRGTNEEKCCSTEHNSAGRTKTQQTKTRPWAERFTSDHFDSVLLIIRRNKRGAGAQHARLDADRMHPVLGCHGMWRPATERAWQFGGSEGEAEWEKESRSPPEERSWQDLGFVTQSRTLSPTEALAGLSLSTRGWQTCKRPLFSPRAMPWNRSRTSTPWAFLAKGFQEAADPHRSLKKGLAGTRSFLDFSVLKEQQAKVQSTSMQNNQEAGKRSMGERLDGPA